MEEEKKRTREREKKRPTRTLAIQINEAGIKNSNLTKKRSIPVITYSHESGKMRKRKKPIEKEEKKKSSSFHHFGQK